MTNKFFDKKISERTVLICILLLAVIILSLPYFIRILSNNNTIIENISYYHTRISQTISKQGPLTYDELSFAGRDYLFNPFHYILAFLNLFLDFNLIARLLPLILGILSVLFFYLILKRLDLDLEKRFLICAILILSPIFIYSFTVLNYHSFVILLLLLAFYSFTLKTKTCFWLTALLLIAASLFNPFSALIGILALLCYSSSIKNLKRFYPIMILFLLFCTAYYLPVYYSNGLPHFVLNGGRIESFVSDIGGKIGFSIFSLILAFIGFIGLYNKKRLPLYFIFIAAIGASFYFNSYFNPYLNFALCIFAGNAFFILIKRKWSSLIIRNFSIIIIICGLLFSPISYINVFSASLPNQQIAGSLEWLEANSNKKDIIFSSQDKGFWIEYFAKRPVMMDSLFLYAPELDERLKDSRDIFNSYRLSETKNLLDKYNIKYIWIDQEMKQQIWEGKKTGLLFLFRNNETFKNIYNKNGIEVWQVLG